MFKKKTDTVYYEANSYDDNNNYNYVYQPPTYQEYETEVYKEEKDKKLKKRTKVIGVIIILYVIYFTIGLFSTPYIRDEEGKKVAKVLNVTKRDEKKTYEQLREYYLFVKDLNEKILTIDATLPTLSETEYFITATKYADLLLTIDKKMTSLKGINIEIKYKVLQEEIALTLDKQALYLQYMNLALSKNDATYLAKGNTEKQAITNGLGILKNSFIAFADYLYITDPAVNKVIKDENKIVIDK